MATKRTGAPDTFHQARLNYITGTTHPAAPVGLYLALFIGTMPDSTGANGSEATGTRPAITLGSPAQDANGRWYITNAGSVSVTIANNSGGEIVGFGLYSAATGGTLLYTDTMPAPFPALANAALTIAAGQIKVYSDK